MVFPADFEQFVNNSEVTFAVENVTEWMKPALLVHQKLDQVDFLLIWQ